MTTQINVIQKISSLIRRKKTFYSLIYSWTTGQIIPLQDQNHYFINLLEIKKQGVTKRCECYVDHFVQFGGKQYAIYMTSYGDIRKWKFIYGQNPISKNFNLCMFDYVYLFVESKEFAQKKIQLRIRQLQKKQKWHDYSIMRKSAQKLFGGFWDKEFSSNTEIHRYYCNQKPQMNMEEFQKCDLIQIQQEN